MRAPRLLLVLGVVLAGSWLSPRAAQAHAVGLSRGLYRALPDGLEAELVFAQTELPATDDAARGIVRGIGVSDSAGRDCPGELASLDAPDASTSRVIARYHCSQPAAALAVELRFWDELSPGHRHVRSGAEQGASADVTELVQREQPRFVLAGVETARRAAPTPSRADWIRLGIEHILTGYDHLAFLLALVLVARSMRALLATVSLFTLAHSLTLALAALDVVAPGSSLVECAIALSICYVGIENLTPRAASSRRALVFGFGLIHGFGFAGALREVGLAVSRAPLALVGFNLGVELGQLALLAASFPLVLALRRTRWFATRGVPMLSAAIALAGAIWFVARLPLERAASSTALRAEPVEVTTFLL